MSAAPDPRRQHLEVVEEAPALVVFNPATGEQAGTLEEHLQDVKDLLAGAETDVNAWRTRHANLKRDKDKDAREHPLWPEVVALFKLWQRECDHGKSAFTPDRFELARPFLERHGKEICEKAILGAAFDPYITTRRNGTKKRHDGWDLIFRNQDKFEEFACKAPIQRKDTDVTH